MRTVFITGAARTPMGGFQGIFSSVDAPTLGGAAIKAALDGVIAEIADIGRGEELRVAAE